MDIFDVDETSTRLKSGLDINELRDPDGEGVEFEVDENDLAQDDKEQDNDIRIFEKKKVEANICLLSDNEDDDNEDDGVYLTEKERLQKHLLKIPESDITIQKDGGVLKDLKQKGVGSCIPEGSLVIFHYNGFTDVGQAPFDSSRLRNEYAKLRLGKGQMIPGLELAILSMKKHERARFLIHHKYAYGEMGCPPRIPKATSLIYDVEIQSFVEQDGVDEYQDMTEAERRQKMTIENLMKVVKAQNEEGKEYFKRREFNRAFMKYRKSEEILQKYHLKNDDEEKQWTEQITKVFVNCAVCSTKLNHHGRVITYCNNVLRNDKDNAKAHYMKGKALHALGSFEESKQSLKKARRIKPTDQDINKALKDLEKSIRDHAVFEKDLYSKMFSKPGIAGDASSTKADEKNDDIPNHETCSDDFKALVQKKFEEFKNDSGMYEMPMFPCQGLTPGEIACILETAEDLGLGTRTKGQSDMMRYEVYKK